MVEFYSPCILTVHWCKSLHKTQGNNELGLQTESSVEKGGNFLGCKVATIAYVVSRVYLL